MFKDTDYPVCLAFFTPLNDDFYFYIGDSYISKYKELKNKKIKEVKINNKMVVNEKEGNVGVYLLDNTNG